MKKRKYQLLFSPGGGRKPGPKGPSAEVINTIVEMKRRNPRFGYLDGLLLRGLDHHLPELLQSGVLWRTET